MAREPNSQGKGRTESQGNPVTKSDLNNTDMMRILADALDAILRQHPVGYDCRITELAGGALATYETWKHNVAPTRNVLQLSTGVELGIWALPARPDESLKLDMTTEEIQAKLADPKFRDELKVAIGQVKVGEPLHRPDLTEYLAAKSATTVSDTTHLKRKLEVALTALKFYGKHGAPDSEWVNHVCDSYSGLVSAFDWLGEIQDEPWEVAEKAIAEILGADSTRAISQEDDK